MCNKDIHKGGRPPKPQAFYASILQQYDTMTIGQIATCHGVSKTTVSRWLRIAREGVPYGQSKPKA